MEIEVPAGATRHKLTIEKREPNLAGIRTPNGFKLIGKTYCFGPHGLRFEKNKELRVKIRFKPEELKDYSINTVRLYYINTENKELERIPEQFFNTKQDVLEAKLTHFSSYVTGIESDWDGNGINPFMDYVHNGEEHVSVANLNLTILFPVFSIQSRKWNIDLTRSFSSSNDRSRFTYICDGWYWAFPHVDNSSTLCLPNGGTYKIPFDYRKPGPYTQSYNFGAMVITIKVSKNGSYGKLESVSLSDGTKIQIYDNYQIVSDPNGNWLRYNIDTIRNSYSIPFKRITSMISSAGHKFNFKYCDASGIITLTKVEQSLSNNTKKTILTLTGGNYYNIFTDALGRTTTYAYTDNTQAYIKKITYQNGLVSSYKYKDNKISSQTFTQTGSTPTKRTVTYTPTYDNPSLKNRLLSVTVNDGICKKNYHLTDTPLKPSSIPPKEAPGYTKTEETYTISGKLLKKVDNNYKFIKNSVGYYEFAIPLKVTTTLVKADGSLGTSATYDYTYDDWNNITKIKDPYGTVTRMAYANTSSNKKLTELDSRMQDYRFSVSSTVPYNRLLTKATLITDPLHGTTQLKQTHYKYDSKGNLTQESEVYGNTYFNTKYTYDSYGNVLTKTDANGNKLGFEYSDKYKNAYLTKVYKPDTGQTIATYNYNFDTGLKTKATDPKGNIYRYEYDAIGRLTKEFLDNSNPQLGVARQIGYNDAKSLVTLKYGGYIGGAWQSGYQEGRIYYNPLFGKPSLIQRKLNGQWIALKENSYDTNGRLTAETDGMSHTITHKYDALDRKIQTKLPDGATTSWDWNERTCTITDANGNRKIEIYDKLDRLSKVQDFPESGVTYTTSYTYDNYDDPDTSKTDSRLLQVTNPKGAATTYTYDNLGRLTRVDYPQDGANPMAPEIYTYDNVGNLTAKTTGKGTKILDYEFWAGYRLRQTTEADGRTVYYTYDPNDNIINQTFPGGSYDYTYDARNRVTGLTANLDGLIFSFNYEYDVLGRMTGISYPNRISPVTYSYDELDRLQEIPGFVSSCEYDLDNKLTEMIFANGVANNYTYDNNDRPINISAGAGSLLSLDYTYDPVGNITRINNDYYGYDGLNRLVWYGNQTKEQMAVANGTCWTYDGAGNMTGKETLLNGVGQGITSFNYDLANRLWSMGATTYENDAAGARTGKTNADYWRYVYDGESRLTQVSKNGVSRIDCAYDGNGMRVKKVEDGKTTYYVYSGPNPLIEYSPTDGKYLYRIYAGKQAVAEEKDGVVKFYHKDHLGSTRVVTDAAGVKIAEYKFAPYGEKELSNGDGTEYGFTDKAEDVTTGLQYFGARFYDAECGRFISQDPAKDGANWFAYCTNNPISYIDPDGKKTVAIIVRENICGLWVGTHAAVYVDNPKGEPVLYDPAGSTYTPEDSWGYSARGSGDTFLGEFADLDSYVESYKGNDKKTELIVFNTTAEEESQIAENIDSLGGVGAFLCSTAVSEVLKGIGPFENLENHLFPGGLSKQLNNIKNEGNKEEDNEGESE